MKLLLILKMFILFLLVVFLLLFNTLPKTDCESCRAVVDDKEVSFNEFLDLYYDQCIHFGEIELPNPFRSSIGDNKSEGLIPSR